MAWAIAISAVLATSLGHILFKQGVQNRQRIITFAGLGSLGGAIVMTYFALRTLDIGSAFMLTALTPFLTSVGATIWMRERVPAMRWVAIALCCAGLLIYQLG